MFSVAVWFGEKKNTINFFSKNGNYVFVVTNNINQGDVKISDVQNHNKFSPLT